MNAVSAVVSVGAPEHFDDVYRGHYRRVVAAMRLTGLSLDDAEDVTQEAFAKAFGGWGRVALGTNPAGYVYRSAFRLSARRRRVTGREEPLTVTETADLSSAGELTDALAIRTAVSALPRRQRDCVLMCLLAGFTSTEAGRILHIRPSTVRVHVMTGRQTLQRVLGPTS